MRRRVRSQVYILLPAAQRPIRTTETFAGTRKGEIRTHQGVEASEKAKKIVRVPMRYPASATADSLVVEQRPIVADPTSDRQRGSFVHRNYFLKPLEMRARISLVRFFGCLLLVAVVGTANTCAEPEPMARPTRPKAIASPEELERYFDLVRDYYSLRRARYGKRGGDATSRMSELNATWETLKTIVDAQRQNQQRRLGKPKSSKEQETAYRDYHSLDTADRHASRLPTRPAGYFMDVVGRYYDDVQ